MVQEDAVIVRGFVSRHRNLGLSSRLGSCGVFVLPTPYRGLTIALSAKGTDGPLAGTSQSLPRTDTLTLCLDTLCESTRGGIFDFTKSSTWQPEGFFELGVDVQLGNSAYAEYGLDDLTFGTTGVTIPSAIIGSINATEDFVGYFGLGIVPGNFTNVTPLAAISGLVEKEAAIPSHSYAFTAGANYRE